MLAAVLEAAIAALYLEHGFEAIEPAIVAAFSEQDRVRALEPRRLQDRAPGGARPLGQQVHYTVLEVEGPPHDRRFVCAAHVAGAQLGIGRGSTKKAAEQEAARQALEALGVVPESVLVCARAGSAGAEPCSTRRKTPPEGSRKATFESEARAPATVRGD